MEIPRDLIANKDAHELLEKLKAAYQRLPRTKQVQVIVTLREAMNETRNYTVWPEGNDAKRNATLSHR